MIMTWAKMCPLHLLIYCDIYLKSLSALLSDQLQDC